MTPFTLKTLAAVALLVALGVTSAQAQGVSRQISVEGAAPALATPAAPEATVPATQVAEASTEAAPVTPVAVAAAPGPVEQPVATASAAPPAVVPAAGPAPVAQIAPKRFVEAPRRYSYGYGYRCH
jgi:hypothetical protein